MTDAETDVAADAIAAQLLDDALLSLAEVAACCRVEIDWVIARVQDAVLHEHGERGERGEWGEQEPTRWSFNGADLRRLRRIRALERDFDATPELAALVADLLDERERLRARLRLAGLAVD